jgi:hypothetical protein
LLFCFAFGAGKEARTLDLYLGKVSLYQLSYSREASNYSAQNKQELPDAQNHLKKLGVLGGLITMGARFSTSASNACPV